MVREQLTSGCAYTLFNQRFADMAMKFETSADHITGQLQIEGRTSRLEDFGGVPCE
jgi:hypothetical protein